MMEDSFNVWQLKTPETTTSRTTSHDNNNNIGSNNNSDEPTESQLSMSSLDTDDETNIVAAGTRTQLHRLQHSQAPTEAALAGGQLFRLNDEKLQPVARLRPFPAHQDVLDTLISAKSVNGSVCRQLSDSRGLPSGSSGSCQEYKSLAKKQLSHSSTQPKEQIQQVSRSSSDKKPSSDEKRKYNQPFCDKTVIQRHVTTTSVATKKPTTAVAAIAADQQLPHLTLRRLYSKPIKTTATASEIEEKRRLKASLSGNITSVDFANQKMLGSYDGSAAKSRDVKEVKSSKSKSKSKSRSLSSSMSASANRKLQKKFDDNDEYIMSPVSQLTSFEPVSSKRRSEASRQTTREFDNTDGKSKQFINPFSVTSAALTASSVTRNGYQSATALSFIERPFAELARYAASGDNSHTTSTIVPPLPPLSIDSSRWKSTSASSEVGVVTSNHTGSRDSTPGQPVNPAFATVRRRFFDRADLSPTEMSKNLLSEDIQKEELRKLKQDLQWAKDQVTLLTSQLCTNTKVVEAFDISLSKMLVKLQAIAAVNKIQNPDVNRLMDTIEALRQQNINHCIRQRWLVTSGGTASGVRSLSSSSCGGGYDKNLSSSGFIGSSYYSGRSGYSNDDDSTFYDDLDSLEAFSIDDRSDTSYRQRRSRAENESSLETEKLNYFKTKLKQKNSAGRNEECDSGLAKSRSNELNVNDNRQASVASVATTPGDHNEKKSVKHWLKSSFGRALSRIRTPSVTSSNAVTSSNMGSSTKKDMHVSSLPSIPAHVTSRSYYDDPFSPLTPIPGQDGNVSFKRFTSKGHHDFPSPTNTIFDGSEMNVSSRSKSNSRVVSPMNYSQSVQQRFPVTARPSTSLADPYHRRSDSVDLQGNWNNYRPSGLDLKACKRQDGHQVTATVVVENVDENTKQYTFVQGGEIHLPIGTIKVGDAMTWMVLDRLIRKTFEDHLNKIDALTKLGMNGDSILHYRIGEILRKNDDKSFLESPELLPVGYLVGDVTNISITLKSHREGCVDALAFECLMPKATLLSYVHLLMSHKRIILIGSSGTGKTYLAKRLADYLVALAWTKEQSSKTQSDCDLETTSDFDLLSPHFLFPCFPHHRLPPPHLQKNLIAIYRVDSKSSRELRQYLNNVAQQYQELNSNNNNNNNNNCSKNGGYDTGTEISYKCNNVTSILSEVDGGVDVDRVAASKKSASESTERENGTESTMNSRNYGNSSAPLAIVLDNLHHVTSLGDAFSGFFELDLKNGPYLIGTMQWSPSSSTSTSSVSPLPSPSSSPSLGSPPYASAGSPNGDLQFHHNFRWIIYSNKVEPVRGFLSRYLARCLVASTVAKISLFSRRSIALPANIGVTAENLFASANSTPMTSPLLDLHLSKVIDWLPQAWQQINTFLESSSARDITLGPRLFLTCPMEAVRAELWFVDLWNYSIVPYLMEAVKNKPPPGSKPQWSKLADWLTATMPWKDSSDKTNSSLFLHFRPEDLGFCPQQKTPSSSLDALSTPAPTGLNRSTDNVVSGKERKRGDDDVFQPEVESRDVSCDVSLLDIVSRFQAAALQSSSSEASSLNLGVTSEEE